jgi:hypothetical protein
MKSAIGAATIMLAACASYQPVQESTFAALTSDGCRDEGRQMLVEAYVSKAYENTVVLWDGTDAQSTVAVTLPGRGVLGRMRGWFGDSKHEVTQQTLNQLAAERTPVTVGVVCQGGKVAPEAASLRYVDAQGQRVAIAY